MPAIPSITDAEWHVMKTLWDRPGEWLSAAEVVDPVVRERQTHHRTVRTLLARLVRKGAVEADAEPSGGGGGFRYRARIAPEAVVRRESASFLARVFDGNAAPALVHLLTESRDALSPQQLQQLRDLLNRKAKP